jgi:hypothetical protein
MEIPEKGRNWIAHLGPSGCAAIVVFVLGLAAILLYLGYVVRACLASGWSGRVNIPGEFELIPTDNPIPLALAFGVFWLVVWVIAFVAYMREHTE